jgi:hypothetical protein
VLSLITGGKFMSCTIGVNRLILILALMPFGFGCSQTKFDSSSSNSNGANGGLGTETHTPGGTDASGNLIQPPTPPQAFSTTNCMLGYNNQVANAPTPAQVIFNESDILTAVSPATSLAAIPGITLSLWYSDEHAMTLGVRHTTVIDAAGNQSDTDYALSTLMASPDVVSNPRVGATALTGDQAGTDTSVCSDPTLNCGRPLYPAVFVTDITTNSGSTAGDWQNGGTALIPDAIYGTWKGATRIVNHQTNSVQIVVDGDPQPNNSNVGSGISVPPGTGSEGFSTVVSWDVAKMGLQAGHTYRIQFMVHDGDEHYTGGDVGENCVNISVH